MSTGTRTERSAFKPAYDLFVRHFGREAVYTESLSAHGSERTILRLKSSSGENCVGVINHNIDENRAFIEFGSHFRNFGLNVPEIYCVSNDHGAYLIQDLGNTTLLNRIASSGQGNFGNEERKLYSEVIEILPRFQITAGKSVDYSPCYQFSEFGEDNIRYDLDYFQERFLKNFYKQGINSRELKKDFDVLTGKLLEPDRTHFLYRDFQSRNIMLSDGEFYFIDFQSGRRGALLYDIASLLYDAKAGIPHTEREYLVNYYLDVADSYINIDKSKYYSYFWYFAVIRILQAMGAYGFLGIVKGKTQFLESIPLALSNIKYIFENKIKDNQFPYLRKIFTGIQYEKT